MMLLPAAVAIVGLLVYVLSSNPKASELGRILLFCGVLVLLFVLARDVVKLH